MSTDLSIIELFGQASFLVKIVMTLLMAASVASWYFIFQRRSILRHAKSTADRFEDRFWAGGNLAEIYGQLKSTERADSGLERIFRAGFREFSRMRKQPGVPPDAVVEAAQRSMRVTLAKEIDHLENHLAFLATVGSTSPYVGLFGTVWGIMTAFRALGHMQQATLATVAPGIAEALIATALGLFAAIPAVIGYNRYASQVEKMTNRYETFMEEFLSILQRHVHGQAASQAAEHASG